jgi:ubiquinone biosynthesis protein
VVVEGVARSLSPQLNIWEVAHPIVEDYIKQSIGPRAVLHDLARTARVLGRFGPRLPQLVDAILTRQAQDTSPTPQKPSAKPAALVALGMALGGGAVLLGLMTSGLW